MRSLCTALERLSDDAAHAACNIEDGLNALQSLHHFSGWPRLRAHLTRKTDETCRALVDEISLAAQSPCTGGYRTTVPQLATAQRGRIATLKQVSSVVMTDFRGHHVRKNKIRGNVRSNGITEGGINPHSKLLGRINFVWTVYFRSIITENKNNYIVHIWIRCIVFRYNNLSIISLRHILFYSGHPILYLKFLTHSLPSNSDRSMPLNMRNTYERITNARIPRSDPNQEMSQLRVVPFYAIIRTVRWMSKTRYARETTPSVFCPLVNVIIFWLTSNDGLKKTIAKHWRLF